MNGVKQYLRVTIRTSTFDLTDSVLLDPVPNKVPDRLPMIVLCK